MTSNVRINSTAGEAGEPEEIEGVVPPSEPVPNKKCPNGDEDDGKPQNGTMGIDFSGDADAATTSYCGTTSFRNVRVADSLRVDSNADMAEEVEQDVERTIADEGSIACSLDDACFPGSLTRVSGMRISLAGTTRHYTASASLLDSPTSSLISLTNSCSCFGDYSLRMQNLPPGQADSQFAEFLKLADKPEVIERFKTLETEDQIFDFLCNVDFVRKFKPEIGTVLKNDGEAAVFRKRACDMMQQTDYQAALKYCNKSIMLARPGSETLALSYLDRSAIFLRTGRKKKSMRDLERALEQPVNKKTREVLESWKARMWTQIDMGSAGLTKNKCVKIVTNMDDPESCVVEPKPDYWESLPSTATRQAISDELGLKQDDSTNVMVQTRPVGVNPCGGDASATSFPVLESVITPLVEDAPEIRRAAELQLKVDDPSPLMPNCSSALEPRYDPVKGRYLVASRDIIPGEVLMCEKPAVKILFRDYWDTHCQKCLKVADACVPCDFCSKVVFCSEECRDASLKDFHRYECPMIANLSEDALEDGCLMCVRLFTRSGPLAVKMLHEALRKTLEEENEKLGVDFAQKGTVDWSHPLTAVASLPNNSSKRERDVLYKAAVDAIYIVKMLKRNRDFWEPLNEEPKADFGKLLTRLAYDYVLVTACNSFCVQDCSFREFGDLTKLRLATVGAGIAPVSNVLQHSCDANVARVFVSKGGVVVGRANKYVKAGDQLELAFGMHYHSKARQERREFLSKMRFFECECPACVGDWQVAEVLDAMDPVFKCPECGVTVSKDVARNVEEFANKTCQSCDAEFADAAMEFKELQSAADYLWSALERGDKDSVEPAIVVFGDLGQKAAAIMERPNKYVARALRRLSKCLLVQANLDKYEDAAEHVVL